MDLKRLTARVARHMDAIMAAKGAGMTWGEVAALFNAPSAEAMRKAFARARGGIETGRIVPIGQMPLPIPFADSSVLRPIPQSVNREPSKAASGSFKRIKID